MVDNMMKKLLVFLMLTAACYGTELRNITVSDPVNKEGYIQVDVEDYNNQLIDTFFLNEVADANFLISATTASTETGLEYTVVVDSGTFTAGAPNTATTGLSYNEELVLIDVVANVFFYAEVQASVDNSPLAGQMTLTLDRPIDHLFPTATTLVKKVNSHMSVNGSVTPQFFVVSGGTSPAHINRIIISMVLDDTPYGNLFGDIAVPANQVQALLNGVVLRHWNGTDYTLFNWKDNAGIQNTCYDVNIQSGTLGPSGEFGLSARITFNGKDKHGSTIEIATGDRLQVIIQDDLTSLLDFRIMAQGHYHGHSL
jgi:hypothetical protein